jgi:phage/plasmid-associated DNA primase
LSQKLAVEAPGILAQLVRYSLVAYRDGEGQIPNCVLSAGAEYQEDSDLLGQFLAEYTTRDFPHEKLMKQDLYMAYHTSTGGKCEAKGKFNARLKSRGIEDIHTKRGAAWVGLKLTSRCMEGDAGEDFLV